MDFNSFLEQNREKIEGFEKDPSRLGYFIDEFWRRVENLSEEKTLIVILGLFKLLGYNKFVYKEDDELYVDTGKDLVPFYTPYRLDYSASRKKDILRALLAEDSLGNLPKKWFDYLFNNLEIVLDPNA